LKVPLRIALYESRKQFFSIILTEIYKTMNILKSRIKWAVFCEIDTYEKYLLSKNHIIAIF